MLVIHTVSINKWRSDLGEAKFGVSITEAIFNYFTSGFTRADGITFNLVIYNIKVILEL